jgi:WD40 repeat protein
MGEWTRDRWVDGKYVPDAEPQMKGTVAGSHGSGGSGAGLMSMHPVYEIHLWDISVVFRSAKERAFAERKATLKARNRFIVSWQGSVDAMIFSGDGQSLYTLINLNQHLSGVAPLNRVQIWDVATGQERGSVGDHGTRYHALAFARDGRLLAVTEQQLNMRRPEALYKVRVWDAERRQELAGPRTVTGAGLPLDLDPESLTPTPNTPSQSHDVFSPGSHSSTATSPDGKLKAVRGYRLPLQSTGADGKVKIEPSPTDVTLVDAATGDVLHVLRSYGQWGCRLAFSPDGKTLAVGESSGKIQLWNVAAGRLLLTIPAHSGPVTGLAFRADGRVLASCSDSEIRLWRAATDEEAARRDP